MPDLVILFHCGPTRNEYLCSFVISTLILLSPVWSVIKTPFLLCEGVLNYAKVCNGMLNAVEVLWKNDVGGYIFN